MSQTAKGVPPTHNGRIKYAELKDLPSRPSSGLPDGGAAAGAAASIGWSKQKPVELWTPDKMPSASAAAVLAKDHKAPTPWEPEANSAGRKAALLAVGSAGAALKKQELTKSTGASTHEGWGNSAATQAFHATRPAAETPINLGGGGSAATQAFQTNRTSSNKRTEPQTPDTSDRSLAAAKGAMSSVRRPRANSNPASASRHSANLSAAGSAHALNGATLAHQASVKAKPTISNEAGAVPITTMTRDMFTSHPALKMEKDEIDSNERLHQEAVAMAKKMYNQQQKMLEQAKGVHGSDKEPAAPGTYLNLQDAAYKQAQERLAKLHDEHLKNRELQEYYGNSQSPKRRFSMINKLRRRSSSEGELDDLSRSEKIRKEMSVFSSKLSQVDKTKRDSDREALMAAAQRNVKAQLQGMNPKGYSQVKQSNDWELKARETAEARSEVRNEHKGMIDLGGGKFMDPNDINAIAAARLQPWLDEVNEKAAAERERQAALKMEEENRRQEALQDKAREKELKDMEKQLRQQEKQEVKQKKQQEKEEEKVRKAEEKAAKAEEKRLVKEEKRRSKIVSVATTQQEQEPQQQPSEESAANVVPVKDKAEIEFIKDDEEAGPSEAAPIKVIEETDPTPETVAESTVTASDRPVETKTTTEDSASGVSRGRSSTSKVRGWIRNRFSRGKSLSEDKKRGSFMGGASLKSGADGSTASIDERQSSTREAEPAIKKSEDGEIHDEETQQSAAEVSSLSSDDDLYEDDRGKETVEPPKTIQDPALRTSSSPTRDSRFREEISP